MYESIPDDESGIPALLEEMKANFRTGRTCDPEFRIEQLQKLSQALEDNKDSICEAMYKDLGRDKFDANLIEI